MAVSRPTGAGRDAAANERETAMAEEAARSRLGRGLAALIGDVGEETAAVERARGQRRVPVEFLRPNPRNPRQSYSEVELDELAASIRERGIIQPIVARTLRGSADHYEIIAGERRWRAAQRAGMHDVPIVLFEASDREAIAQERAGAAGRTAKRRPRAEKDADTLALEKRLSDALGLNVSVEHRGKGGELKIRYRSLEQLDEVVRRLERG